MHGFGGGPGVAASVDKTGMIGIFSKILRVE